jgi:hypothetical protein
MAKRSVYDPGKPTPIRKTGPDTYAVDSFRGEDASYTVTLGSRPSCSCPHFVKRLAETPGEECKHITDTRRQQRFLEAALGATKLSDEQLLFWLRHHTEKGNAIVAGALRCERARRQAAARKDAELKAVFA